MKKGSSSTKEKETPQKTTTNQKPKTKNKKHTHKKTHTIILSIRTLFYPLPHMFDYLAYGSVG